MMTRSLEIVALNLRFAGHGIVRLVIPTQVIIDLVEMFEFVRKFEWVQGLCEKKS